MADRKVVVKNADMSEDMQQDAIDISTQVFWRECDFNYEVETRGEWPNKDDQTQARNSTRDPRP